LALIRESLQRLGLKSTTVVLEAEMGLEDAEWKQRGWQAPVTLAKLVSSHVKNVVGSAPVQLPASTVPVVLATVVSSSASAPREEQPVVAAAPSVTHAALPTAKEVAPLKTMPTAEINAVSVVPSPPAEEDMLSDTSGSFGTLDNSLVGDDVLSGDVEEDYTEDVDLAF
jgi:hypothetical protein